MTAAGLKLSVKSEIGGFTVKVAVPVSPLLSVPAMVTGVDALTALVLIVNVAVVEPAGMVTLAGTVATAVLLLDRFTVVPPVGATVFNVTVPVEGFPPVTTAGFRLRVKPA